MSNGDDLEAFGAQRLGSSFVGLIVTEGEDRDLVLSRESLYKSPGGDLVAAVWRVWDPL